MTVVDPFEQLAANPYREPDTDVLLDEAIQLLADARTSTMGSSIKIDRDELLGLLLEVRERLPEELRSARWLLKEREDFIRRARGERDEIIVQGRQTVEGLIERQAVVRAAEARARQVMAEAEAESRLLRRQTEDYCDRKLAGFEQLLAKTQSTIAHGRDRLLGAASLENSPPPPPAAPLELD